MSDHTYAGELDADNVCLRCIVGTAEWATGALGGFWVDSLEKVGIGWSWDPDTGFTPPLELEEDDGNSPIDV